MTAYVYFVRGAKHAAMARTSIESVRKGDASAQIMVMTDETPGQRIWGLDALTYYIPPGMPIMLANLEAQVTALFQAADEPIVFLDTDTLLIREFASELKGDIAVTWRDHVKVVGEDKVEGIAGTMPYNYGVIVTRKCQPAIEAFIWMRERIRRMQSQHQQWYGNQLALAELAGPRPTEGSRVDRRTIPWTLTAHGSPLYIEKLPCETYNYTPQVVGEAIHGRRALLHFKGGSRALMESYARRLGLGWYSENDVRKAA